MPHRPCVLGEGGELLPSPLGDAGGAWKETPRLVGSVLGTGTLGDGVGTSTKGGGAGEGEGLGLGLGLGSAGGSTRAVGDCAPPGDKGMNPTRDGGDAGEGRASSIARTPSRLYTTDCTGRHAHLAEVYRTWSTKTSTGQGHGVLGPQQVKVYEETHTIALTHMHMGCWTGKQLRTCPPPQRLLKAIAEGGPSAKNHFTHHTSAKISFGCRIRNIITRPLDRQTRPAYSG
jgi:hypothetical protein